MLCADKMVKDNLVDELIKNIDADNSSTITYSEFIGNLIVNLDYKNYQEDYGMIQSFLKRQFPEMYEDEMEQYFQWI